MDFEGLVAILGALVGLPWLILHYVTKWKTAPKITDEDERLLDEMQLLARRLEDRVLTVERIIGRKRGTGGSSGVGFLRAALDLTFFPELLDVRTEIGR